MLRLMKAVKLWMLVISKRNDYRRKKREKRGKAKSLACLRQTGVSMTEREFLIEIEASVGVSDLLHPAEILQLFLKLFGTLRYTSAIYASLSLFLYLSLIYKIASERGKIYP